MTTIEPRLAQLREPAPPASLAPSVMARIARQPVRQPRAPRLTAPARVGGRPAWTPAVAGVVLVATLMLRAWWNAGLPLDLAASRIYAVMPMAVEGPAVPLLVFGLWLCLRGLFAPLRLPHGPQRVAPGDELIQHRRE